MISNLLDCDVDDYGNGDNGDDGDGGGGGEGDGGDDGDDGDDGDGGGEGDHLGKVQRVSLHEVLSTDSCKLHRGTYP